MEIRFTEFAREDIIDSYVYGLARFGQHQADAYEAAIRQVISLIGDNPGLAAERPEFNPPVRIHHHARHYIVYTVATDHVLVLRVLRDEMDLARHLTSDSR